MLCLRIHLFNIFNYSDCRRLHNKYCNCYHIYIINGYYVICDECKLRHPEELLYPLPENIKQAFYNL